MIYEIGNTAYLPGGNAIVTMEDCRSLTIDGDYPATSVSAHKQSGSGVPSGDIKFIQWGKGDRLPLEIINKVYKNVTTGANIEFNNRLGIGDGILVYRKVKQGNKVVPVPVLESEAPEVFDFLMKCNYNRIIQEMIADINVFADANAE